MKKEQLCPAAQNIFDMMMSTENINMIAEYYQLPTHVRAQVIEDTNTVEERNMEIFRLCFMFYVATVFKLDTPDEVYEMIKNNPMAIMDSFIKHTVKLITLVDCNTGGWRNEH